MANAEKEKALELAVSAIEKQFGKGSVMRLGEGEGISQDIAAISTGSISLDLALGVGGVPRGRIVEIYGPESSGKTTLTLHIVAEAQGPAASRPSSTPSTRSTSATRASWACAPRTS